MRLKKTLSIGIVISLLIAISVYKSIQQQQSMESFIRKHQNLQVKFDNSLETLEHKNKDISHLKGLLNEKENDKASKSPENEKVKASTQAEQVLPKKSEPKDKIGQVRNTFLKNSMMTKFNKLFETLSLNEADSKKVVDVMIEKANDDANLALKALDQDISIEDVLEEHAAMKDATNKKLEQFLNTEEAQQVLSFARKTKIDGVKKVYESYLNDLDLDKQEHSKAKKLIQSYVKKSQSESEHYTHDSLTDMRELYKDSKMGEPAFTAATIKILEKSQKPLLEELHKTLSEKQYNAFKLKIEAPIDMMRRTIEKQS